MRRVVIGCVLLIAFAASGSIRAAAQYPLTLVVSAQAKNATSTVTSTLNIRVDRLMAEANRTRVTDALLHGGYGNFLPALRTLPAIGAIGLEKREVQLKYAREQPDGKGYRLTLVADRPLFFLGAEKARAGYELTIIDLRIDEQGAGTGTMSGAARVKPGPDGSVILDDFAEAPVELTVRPSRPSK